MRFVDVSLSTINWYCTVITSGGQQHMVDAQFRDF